MPRCDHRALMEYAIHWVEQVEHMHGGFGGVDCLDAANWVSETQECISDLEAHHCRSRAPKILAQQAREQLQRCSEVFAHERASGRIETALRNCISRRSQHYTHSGMHGPQGESRALLGRRDEEIITLICQHQDPRDARRAVHEHSLLFGPERLALANGNLSLRSGTVGWFRWYGDARRHVEITPDAPEETLLARLHVIAGLGLHEQSWAESAAVLAV